MNAALVYNSYAEATNHRAMKRTKEGMPCGAAAGAGGVALRRAFGAGAQGPRRRQRSRPQRSGATSRDFAQRVEAALSSNGAEKAYWGVLVVDAETGETLYSLNADHYFKPPPTSSCSPRPWRWPRWAPTSACARPSRLPEHSTAAAVLRGDLVLVGRGDANLSNRVFPFAKQGERAGPADKALAELADQVVARGVKQIRGDIVADDSYFALARFPPGWTVDDTVWSYGAAVSAIAVNDNALSLQVRPGAAAGSPARHLVGAVAGTVLGAQ